jgi:predicted RNA-binding Zn-ribbon protein involved in translation (DUF1610 family)
MFNASKRSYGSPRVHADLLEAGRTVSVNTVADSMRRQGLQGRKPKHSKGLTRQDRKAPKFPDLVKRDFTAPGPNLKWCGDITEIPTDEGKLYMATVLDLFSRRLLAAPTSEHPDAQLVAGAIKIAAAARGGRAKIDSVIFHTDRGSTYTASSFTLLCKDKLGIRQSMGRVGLMLRQRRCRIVFLHPRARSSLPPPLHHQGPSAHCGPGLVPRVLQHPTETQLGGDDGPCRLRTDRGPGRRWKGGGLMNTQTPPGDVSVTAPGCAACGQPLPAGRSRRFCSPACRQAAFRRRHQSAAAETPLQPRRSRLEGTIYQCPECETRYLAEQ